MVSKKSFTLLVDTGTIPIFAVVPIISDGDCSYNIKGAMQRDFDEESAST